MAQDSSVDPARIERLEQRLQVLEDAEAIRNVKVRYDACATDNTMPTGSRCCSPKMRCGESPGLGRFEGREAIRNFFRGTSGIFSFAIHYSLNGHIEVDGDTARARWYLF